VSARKAKPAAAKQLNPVLTQLLPAPWADSAFGQVVPAGWAHADHQPPMPQRSHTQLRPRSSGAQHGPTRASWSQSCACCCKQQSDTSVSLFLAQGASRNPG